MSKSVFIIAPSGAGKTTSIRTLNPSETFIFNALKKDLPWKGSAKQYTYWDKTTNPNGNMVATSHASTILQWMTFINDKMPQIKNIVIDDNTFVTALELQRRSKETTWEKYNDIAQNFIDIAAKSKSLREDICVFILHHTQEEGDGLLEDKRMRAMSYGKLVDSKLGSQEAQFTVVLRAEKEKEGDKLSYVFHTQDAYSTVKTPDGMFNSTKIPNDLQLVRDSMLCYYNDDDCVSVESVKTKSEKVKN